MAEIQNKEHLLFLGRTAHNWDLNVVSDIIFICCLDPCPVSRTKKTDKSLNGCGMALLSCAYIYRNTACLCFKIRIIECFIIFPKLYAGRSSSRHGRCDDQGRGCVSEHASDCLWCVTTRKINSKYIHLGGSCTDAT